MLFDTKKPAKMSNFSFFFHKRSLHTGGDKDKNTNGGGESDIEKNAKKKSSKQMTKSVNVKIVV